MLDINIKTSSIDEIISIISELDYKKIKYHVNLNYLHRYTPNLATTRRKEQRKSKLFSLLLNYNLLTSTDLYNLTKKNSITTTKKTLIRDCFELAEEQKINMTLMGKEKGGFVYLFEIRK